MWSILQDSVDFIIYSDVLEATQRLGDIIIDTVIGRMYNEAPFVWLMAFGDNPKPADMNS